MYDMQQLSKEQGDSDFPLNQSLESKNNPDTSEEAQDNAQSQEQVVTGMRLVLIIVALISAIFLVALVSHISMYKR